MPYLKRILTLTFVLLLAPLAFVDAQGFKQIPLQYIVALGDPNANAGSGAQEWGLWRQDPGPRGCLLKDYPTMKATGGVAPAQWKFDSNDWWLEEHGALMEKPQFPLPPGQYVVTGGREVTTILTVFPKDNDGNQRWELAKGAKLYDVTHLPCRAARYTPANNENCSPDLTDKSVFPLPVGTAMPAVKGCNKKDYAVLFVIGVADNMVY